MKIQQAESKQHDLQAQLLTEQISALQAGADKARSDKEEVTSATTSTGDAELEKLRALAYFHDAIVFEEATVDLLQNLSDAEYTPFLEELWNRVLRGHNTKKSVYGLLCNRYTMIGYRRCLRETTKLTVELKLQLVLQTEHNVATTELEVVVEEIELLLRIPRVKQRSIQEYVRSRKGAWRAGGASSEALQWIARGAKMRWVKGPPPDFDHETSLQDLTQQQQEWLDIETARSLKNGAWGDWCFTFDLEDGYHTVGIDLDFQEFMQFDIQGVLYQCGALPFGWRDSPRICVKLMKTLVELICSPQAGEDRHEVKKLRDGQESVYLAVPTARLYLRELYFVLGKKNSWGSKKEARGFWNDELQKLHITHLELEAVYKTVRSFLSELEGKVVRLYCDNPAVVAMLLQFTSRNPELMRRMRKLWLLLELHDIELQARYLRSEANEWADWLSRDKDLDDWRINKKWFKYAEEQWGEHFVDRFASEISAQLPSYYSAWHDPGCEGVDSLAYDWREEHNWVNPLWGLLDEDKGTRRSTSQKKR
eukprot:gene20173-biopygen20803